MTTHTQYSKMRFSPEDQRLLEPLAAFILSLIQALLKTGYYQSSHPGSTVAKRALYYEWNKLDLADKEISFLIREGAEGEEVFIYGVLSEITSLKTLLAPGMAELFVPKFYQYFTRRHLMSFTIKPAITYEEFEGFVDIMTEIPTAFDPSQIIADMTDNMVHRQVVHVSVVYLEEAPDFKRPMHWMTRSVLTRLGKDLRMIPLYKHLNPEQVDAVKTQIFRELFRPLLNWIILKEILLNCDQIQIAEETGSPERFDLEGQLIQTLRQDQRFGLLSESARDLRQTPHSADSATFDEDCAYRERLFSLIRKVISNLQGGITEGTDEMIETLLKEKVVHLKELPEGLASRFLIRENTENYLRNKQAHWDILLDGWSEEMSKTSLSILSVLLSQDDFHAFEELLGQLCRSFQKTFGLDARFSSDSGVEMLREMIVAGLQARRSVKRKGVLSAIEPCAGVLFEYLLPFCIDDDPWVRRNICRILAAVGEKAIPCLIALAMERKQNWQIVRNVVMIMGEIGLVNDAVLHFLRRCQQHPELQIREEVINSYGKMRGPKVEVFLMQEMDDPNGTLKGPVVLALGHYDPLNERCLLYTSPSPRD